jgi:hypothetical protein
MLPCPQNVDYSAFYEVDIFLNLENPIKSTGP